jgi:DNA-binding transcriptional ArsR family regulator
VTVARALGHPARLRAVAMLRFGELCVCQVTTVLGLAPSTVSLHLRELKRAGIVRERKQGRWVHVGLSDDIEARSWVELAVAAAGPDPQLVRDAAVVDELRLLPVEDLCRLGLKAAKRKAWRRSSAGKRSGR